MYGHSKRYSVRKTDWRTDHQLAVFHPWRTSRLSTVLSTKSTHKVTQQREIFDCAARDTHKATSKVRVNFFHRCLSEGA